MPLAMGTAGSSVIFAALTVIIALCGLTEEGIPFLTVMGLAAAASVTVALLVALTLPPAMLGFAGSKAAAFTRLPLLGARAERVARRSAADPDSPAGPGGPGSSCATGCSYSPAGSPCSACSRSRHCPSIWACPVGPRSQATPSRRPTTPFVAGSERDGHAALADRPGPRPDGNDGALMLPGKRFEIT